MFSGVCLRANCCTIYSIYLYAKYKVLLSTTRWIKLITTEHKRIRKKQWKKSNTERGTVQLKLFVKVLQLNKCSNKQESLNVWFKRGRADANLQLSGSFPHIIWSINTESSFSMFSSYSGQQANLFLRTWEVLKVHNVPEDLRWNHLKLSELSNGQEASVETSVHNNTQISSLVCDF